MARLTFWLIVCLSGSIQAEVHFRTIRSESDIYPVSRSIDCTPENEGSFALNIHTANHLVRNKALILATLPKLLAQNLPGEPSWRVFEIELVTITQRKLIRRIRARPDNFECITVRSSRKNAQLEDPDSWWFSTTRHPVTYRRLTICDRDF